MRAPPESLRPITGAPTLIAWSMTLQIFSACASDSEPPKTVKSCEKTNINRPLMVPQPDDHTVARNRLLGHAEVVAAVLLEHVPLFERATVEQQLDALAGSQFALAVLVVDALLATTQTGRRALFCKLANDVVHKFYSLTFASIRTTQTGRRISVRSLQSVLQKGQQSRRCRTGRGAPFGDVA
jgi:hypothetical protein